MITNAVKMLTSPDPLIRGVAQHSLRCTICKRFERQKGQMIVADFLLKSATEGMSAPFGVGCVDLLGKPEFVSKAEPTMTRL